MEVTRTVKAPQRALHADRDVRPRLAHDDLVRRAEPEPAHLPGPAHRGRRSRQPHRLRRAERVRRRASARRRSCACRGSTPGSRKPNYLPGDVASIHIATDEPTLDDARLPVGAGDRWSPTPTTSSPASRSTRSRSTLDWRRWRAGRTRSRSASRPPRAASTTSQFAGPDGRVGYAPFVVRPAILGQTSRVLVVLPTNTWQAYNFQDVERRRLRRHLVRRPAEPQRRPRHAHTSRAARRLASTATTCRSCTGCTGPARRAEFISDSDFDQIATGDATRATLRPDRLRGARGVRDAARVRRRRSASAISAAT